MTTELDAIIALAEQTAGTVLCKRCRTRVGVSRDQSDGHAGAKCPNCDAVMWYPTCWECVADPDRVQSASVQCEHLEDLEWT